MNGFYGDDTHGNTECRNMYLETSIQHINGDIFGTRIHPQAKLRVSNKIQLYPYLLYWKLYINQYLMSRLRKNMDRNRWSLRDEVHEYFCQCTNTRQRETTVTGSVATQDHKRLHLVQNNLMLWNLLKSANSKVGVGTFTCIILPKGQNTHKHSMILSQICI